MEHVRLLVDGRISNDKHDVQLPLRRKEMSLVSVGVDDLRRRYCCVLATNNKLLKCDQCKGQ